MTPDPYMRGLGLGMYSVLCTLDQQGDSRLEGTDLFNRQYIQKYSKSMEMHKTNNVTTEMQLHTFISRYYIFSPFLSVQHSLSGGLRILPDRRGGGTGSSL